MRGDNKGARMASAMAVVAGRAARPCDVCARKRSRWYCAADEAYLCEGCDSSIHAANALAFRHERVRLTPNGAPVKKQQQRDRQNNVYHGDPQQQKKKALKARPSSNSALSGRSAAAFPPPGRPQSKQHFGANALREVKVELGAGNCGTTDLDPSDDDHFTAEELTGNANLLDEDDPTQMCPPSSYRYSDCSGSHGETDFGHDFLVSDPNDPQNSGNCNGGLVHGTASANSAGGGEGEEGEDAVVDRDEDQNDEEDHGEEEDEDVDESYMGNEWMDLANRNLGGDDDYSIDPSALRESVHDQSVALYSHDEKPEHGGGLRRSPAHMGKAFKYMAGQSEWVKMESGFHHHQHSHSSSGELYENNFDPPPQQQQQGLSNPSCKIEGLAMSETDLRQVPSLRLNYEDVLSSWPDRGMRWTDDGSLGPQLVPDNSNSDAMGSCYDMGMVPDWSGGVDGSGHLSAGMHHSGGVCGGGGADDSVTNAGNGREARVIRYREKRRTRLFSKKIRYEVRKLNAERRPRMKGRFVKRSPSRDS